MYPYCWVQPHPVSSVHLDRCVPAAVSAPVVTRSAQWLRSVTGRPDSGRRPPRGPSTRPSQRVHIEGACAARRPSLRAAASVRPAAPARRRDSLKCLTTVGRNGEDGGREGSISSRRVGERCLRESVGETRRQPAAAPLARHGRLGRLSGRFPLPAVSERRQV